SQDNGTEVYNNSLQWNETDGGDGGTVQIDQLNPNNVYHAINNGIQKSVDGGNTWNGLNIFGGNLYIPFVLDRINTSRIVVGGGSFGNLVAGFQFGNVFQSSDGGNNWTNLNAPISPDVIALASYQNGVYNPNVIYAFGQNFLGTNIVEVTQNLGVTWAQSTPATNGLP